MILRRYIGQRLAKYYAQPSSAVIGSSAEILNLRSLWGEWHWKRIYKRLYEEQDGQWLTPVELFRPYYSTILVNFIVKVANEDESLRDSLELVELGGGRGTNAYTILNHLQQIRPDLYDRTNYTIIDSSPTLLELQQKNLQDNHCSHASKILLEKKDLLDVAEKRSSLLPTRPSSTATTIVMALEVLDNLAHDKIRIRGGGHFVEQAEVRQMKKNLVDGKSELSSHLDFEEAFVPLSDPLLRSILDIAPSFMKGSPIAWIPSVTCGVLQQLFLERPRAQLVVTDFDWLPPPDLKSPEQSHRSSLFAVGEPLITSMQDRDYDCYLHAPELCDILFPTDFRKLATFVEKIWNRKARVMKQAEFLNLYGREEVEMTKSWLTGYSPLIHDFSNCSVLTISDSHTKQQRDTFQRI